MNIQQLGVIIGKNQIDSSLNLNLHDGQKIVGRILSVTSAPSQIASQVLLELAGHTLPARVEGFSVNAGSLFLFNVSLAKQGKIELKIISEFNGENNVESQFENLELNICQQLLERGVKPSPENVVKISRYLMDFQTKYQQILEPKIIAFLMAQKLPVKPDTILFSWLSQDGELRNYLWNLLQKAKMMDRELILKPTLTTDSILKMLEQITTQNVLSQKQNHPQLSENSLNHPDLISTNSENEQSEGQAAFCTVNNDSNKGELTESTRDGGLEKLQTVLKQSIQLSRMTDHHPQDQFMTTGLYPFLIKDSHGECHEGYIAWEERKNSHQNKEKEQLIRIKLYTDNLGDIIVKLSIKPDNAHIRLEVESKEVQAYLLKNGQALEAIMELKTTMTVGLIEQSEQTITGKVDLWM